MSDGEERWFTWEDVIQLGDIRDDRLLIRFGGIDIWKGKLISLDGQRVLICRLV